MPIIKKHETLLDFIAANAGSVEGLFVMANLNGIGISDEPVPGTSLEIEKQAFTIASYNVVIPELVKNVLKKYQTTLDFSTQYFGTAEALFLMANLNGIAITDEPAPGTQLVTETVDLKVVTAYRLNGLDITTAINYDPSIIYGGIGYMQIQNDFKVS